MERRKSNKFINILALITALCSVVIIGLMILTLSRNINFFVGALLSFLFLIIIAVTNLVVKLVSKRKIERRGIPLAIFTLIIITAIFTFSFVMFIGYI